MYIEVHVHSDPGALAIQVSTVCCWVGFPVLHRSSLLVTQFYICKCVYVKANLLTYSLPWCRPFCNTQWVSEVSLFFCESLHLGCWSHLSAISDTGVFLCFVHLVVTGSFPVAANGIISTLSIDHSVTFPCVAILFITFCYQLIELDCFHIDYYE